MKIIYYINKFALTITLVLYLTVFYGLFAQIALGAIQLLSALILFIYWKKFDSSTKKRIKYYWVAVIIYGLLWLLDWTFVNELLVLIIGVILFPMLIASYFINTLNYIKNLK